MRFTLRQLQVFLAIARYQNVTRAAESLSMSQSACSGSLKDLESLYDIKLFDRVGKRLQTNEFARMLRPQVEALLEQANSLEQNLNQHDNIGQLNIGATLTIGNYLAVELLQAYVNKKPLIKAHLDVANTQEIAKKLVNFEIDIGLVEGELHHKDLCLTRWREDELVCFCSPKHPLANSANIDDSALRIAPWILREPGSGTRQTFDRAMTSILTDLHIEFELQHTEAIVRAVEANLGISCLSRIALEDSFTRGSLVPIELPEKNFRRWLYLVIHKEKYISSTIQHWLDICEVSIENTPGTDL